MEKRSFDYQKTPSIHTPETFSQKETEILEPYFTNLDKPVFALVNLPEVVKGALFARYSRSSKSLRRLFLDEFAADLSDDNIYNIATGNQRAEKLYDKVFLEYGDDSVAQLGGAHLACEQASNVLTKILEHGRLMSYLEQSTRYINYDQPLNNRYRYYLDSQIMESEIGQRYTYDLDNMFKIYSNLLTQTIDYLYTHIPKNQNDSNFAYNRAIKAAALDSVRGILPAATLSNVGIYGSGQAYEALLLKMRANPLPESQLYADMMLDELRKVIPSFLKRVDLPDRGIQTSQYLADNHLEMNHLSSQIFSEIENNWHQESEIELVDFDPDGENKMIIDMLYLYTTKSEKEIRLTVEKMSVAQKVKIIKTYCGNRQNRRHRPGRALERTAYKFDILSDYGAFRDLQRHRLLTMQWQPLSVYHGYITPPTIIEAGLQSQFDEAMNISSQLYEFLKQKAPHQASYAVALAYKIRYSMQMNVREAMHVLELRTTPQGHPSYRKLCQQMYKQIVEKAGHVAVAEMMSFINLDEENDLGRLEAENKNQAIKIQKS